MRRISTIILLVITWTIVAFSQIPRTISYQGLLTNKPPDGSPNFTFRFYTVAEGGEAIWSEKKALEVKNGLFSTQLGDTTPFGAGVKFDKPYWLGIQLGDTPELAPRVALTSVGYSLSAVRADTASVALASMMDSIWIYKDSDIYRLKGNVGIGKIPSSKLDVEGEIRGKATTQFAFKALNPEGQRIFGVEINSATEHSGNLRVFDAKGDEAIRLNALPTGHSWINNGGNLGIGTTNPTYKLQVNQSSNENYVALFQNGGGSGPGVLIKAGTAGSNYPLLWVGNYAGNVCRFFISGNGRVGIGTTNPSTTLDVVGRTKTQVLEITGSDFAEPFEIAHNDTLPLGSVVVLDADKPGMVLASTKPYDKRVVGVISGAGGIYPGIMVTKADSTSISQYVALTGKVYTLATVANGVIQPGDLLTTSDVPGHAMKATQQKRRAGAVIGKAMSRLEHGEGLVLVLVQPQ